MLPASSDVLRALRTAGRAVSHFWGTHDDYQRPATDDGDDEGVSAVTYHAAVTWVRARRAGVLGFGVLVTVLLSAFTLAGAFFEFDFTGDRESYPALLDFEPRPFVCLGGEQPCPDDPSEICCKPSPDAHFWFGTAE